MKDLLSSRYQPQENCPRCAEENVSHTAWYVAQDSVLLHFLEFETSSSQSSQPSNALYNLIISLLKTMEFSFIWSVNEKLQVIHMNWIDRCNCIEIFHLWSIYTWVWIWPFNVPIPMKAHMLKTFCMLWNQYCLKYPTGQVWPHSFWEASDIVMMNRLVSAQCPIYKLGSNILDMLHSQYKKPGFLDLTIQEISLYVRCLTCKWQVTVMTNN